jgi:hypothetical protein
VETTNVLTEEKLYRFLEEHGNNRVKRELLAFWGKHPDANFSRRVICYALNCGKLEAEGALRAMVEEGLLDKHITNGVTLYSLTTDEEKRRPVLELATLGWEQWNIMIKHIERRDKSVKCQPEEEIITVGKLQSSINDGKKPEEGGAKKEVQRNL